MFTHRHTHRPIDKYAFKNYIKIYAIVCLFSIACSKQIWLRLSPSLILDIAVSYSTYFSGNNLSLKKGWTNTKHRDQKRETHRNSTRQQHIMKKQFGSEKQEHSYTCTLARAHLLIYICIHVSDPISTVQRKNCCC